MVRLFQVNILGETKSYQEGTPYLDIAKEYQPQISQDIVLTLIDGKFQELHKTVQKDCTLEFVTTADDVGMQSYKRSVCQMLLKAIYDVAEEKGFTIEKVNILFSLSKGYYCEIVGDLSLNQEFLGLVRARMKELVQKDLPIQKRNIHTDDAITLFRSHAMYDKERLFKFRRVSRVNVYRIGEFEDYYYGYMVPSTGYLKYFDLELYDQGFVLCLPTTADPKSIPGFEPQKKLFGVLKESKRWGEQLGLTTVGELNEKISRGQMKEIILVQEALQEKKIAEIAEMVAKDKDKKFVMVAGPSSSGKTTFSHRLSIQLLAHGMNPHPIALDDYFINRLDCPKDEDGEYDFESLKALDVAQFNQDMAALLRGETVELPTYNFKTGLREYHGHEVTLGKEDILVLEGIHGLNDELSPLLPLSSKFKIYISALTQLNIDEHNRIPSSDGRMIRRMVRDARTRGIAAKGTISMWNSVRRGEERNIFPYQEQADIMFNSALIYELAVLKFYAEPILFGIDRDDPAYLEAKRLLKFLDYFVGINAEDIPKNSILREFIGGSCYKV
jgi:uridine kinase